jgi:hypothetical protein
MNYKKLYRIIGAVVFLISATVLFMTAQPTVSFWDVGEFTAAGYALQVPHPPGTPFFLLLNRIFAMIPIFHNIGHRINTVSVLGSAFSILFLYLIIIKVIENYRGREPKNLVDGLGTYLSAAIGALAFSFSDTFWFSGSEGIVFGLSLFLFSAIVYLMMLWSEKADNKDNEKYIFMIAYLIGLSTGVHLMSVLAIVGVGMMIIIRKYVTDDDTLKKTGFIFLAHIVVIILIACALWASRQSTTPPTPEEYQAFDFKFKMILLAISALFVGAFWKTIFNRSSFYLPVLVGGVALFVTYPGIVKLLPTILASVSGNSIFMAMFLFLIIFAILIYLVHYYIKTKKQTLHLVFMSIVFILLGFSTYAMIIIRANQDPPMNENDPKDISTLITYLDREQYGDFPIFERRFTTEPYQQGVYTNYSSELDFWWRYQMNHMMTRYLLWNFAGRESWVQDAGPNIAPFNSIGNALGKVFSIHFAGDEKDSLFGLPFLFGLLGLYFHFKKDWKLASIFFMLFMFMGYLTAFYQNQQESQPRERDYFYVGAYMIFSLWIAIGFRGLIDLIYEKIADLSKQKLYIFGLLIIGFVAVPVNMVRANYFVHDRSHNWVPWDYSYNILQSCAPDAVLFTNGDNDTFPLWYLQDVEGVRRDVKVVCLSLVNTPWYIEELKHNDPYHVGTIAMNLTDSQIEQIRPVQWTSQDVTIPVPPDINTRERITIDSAGNFSNLQAPETETSYAGMDIKDSTVIKSGELTFRMNPTVNFGNIKAIRIQDIMVRDIIEANHWKRPIYFAVTCSQDARIGLDDYLKLEGMALRLVPEKRSSNFEFLNVPALREELLRENHGFSRDFDRGFKFRGLANPNIFLDDNHQRMLGNYRNAFIRLALYYENTGQKNSAVAVLDTMEAKMPRQHVEFDYRMYNEVGNIYLNAGRVDKYKKIASEVEEDARQALKDDPSDLSPYRVLIDVYQNLNENVKLLDLWRHIQSLYPQDPTVRANVEKYQKIVAAQDSLTKSKK